MVLEQIIPDLKTLYPTGSATVKRYFTFGVSESALSDQLDTLQWPEHIELGYRSSRITSYNVCYTKLLRVVFQLASHAIPVREDSYNFV